MLNTVRLSTTLAVVALLVACDDATQPLASGDLASGNLGGVVPSLAAPDFDDAVTVTGATLPEGLALAPASLIAIENPNANYQAETNRIDISGLTQFDDYSSITDGTQTIGFSLPLNKLKVGDGWATWSCPPFSEECSPHLLYSNGFNAVTLTLSVPSSTFGVEVEPEPFFPQIFFMTLSSGGEPLGTITRIVGGNGGARLLAVRSDVTFDEVTILATSPFALAQFRYGAQSDQTPPEITLDLDVEELWPPNHKMVAVATVSATDETDPNPTVSISVTSDEPDDGTGDGDTPDDTNVIDNGDGTFTVEVRAERAGNGDGRTYTIEVTATDASGNEASATAEVSVPLSKGRKN